MALDGSWILEIPLGPQTLKVGHFFSGLHLENSTKINSKGRLGNKPKMCQNMDWRLKNDVTHGSVCMTGGMKFRCTHVVLEGLEKTSLMGAVEVK